MPTIEYKGKSYEVDEDGFLSNPENWDEDFAQAVADQEGITDIGEEHWKVIHYLQDYYAKNGIAPMVRIMTKVTGYKLKKIYELFPSGPGKGACKMAGLAKPTGCV
ncbi:MAG: TusE/DsrC/DsvC family sulfur relay protein [Proteobacteria bacterium]|nr:TusE/DsrC/DsvC family sulfur relay protein [Pseudomonadota bacterium]